MKYFKFELKRCFTNRKNKVLFSVMSILLLALVAYSVSLKVSNTPKSIESYVEQNLAATNQSYQKVKDDKNVPKDIIVQLKSSLQFLNQEKMALKSDDINQYYNIQLKLNQLTMKAGNWAGGDLKAENSYIKTVQKRHLNFENYSGAQIHSFGIAHEVLFALIFSSLFYLILLLMGGISLAADIETDRIKLYKTPIFKNQNPILTSFFVNVFVVSAWYLLAVVLYFVSVGFLNGFGALNYPSGIPKLFLVENWKIDSLYLLWGFVVISFITSLGIFLSLLLKRTLLVVGAFAIIILGFDMIKSQNFMTHLNMFLPMSYFNRINLWQGIRNFPPHPLIVGLIYLISLSLLFMIIANLLFKKMVFRKA